MAAPPPACGRCRCRCGGGAGGFRVRVDLRRYYGEGDPRARCLLWLPAAARARPVRWLAARVRRRLPPRAAPRPLALSARGHLLPAAEPLHILRATDTLQVIPLETEWQAEGSADESAMSEGESVVDSGTVAVTPAPTQLAPRGPAPTELEPCEPTLREPALSDTEQASELRQLKQRALALLEQCDAGSPGRGSEGEACPPGRRRRRRVRRRARAPAPVIPPAPLGPGASPPPALVLRNGRAGAPSPPASRYVRAPAPASPPPALVLRNGRAGAPSPPAPRLVRALAHCTVDTTLV